jgi:DNA-binding transcriptional LysR family regulator
MIFYYQWGQRMIDLKSLETFVWVARLSNFRIAAERLNTTQPAVSARISGLERALGIKILTRTTRSVRPTQKGLVLLDYAERFLALREEMLGVLVAPAERVGRLRLGVAETVVHTWLPSLLEQATELFPRLELEIEVDISANLRGRLLSRELDMAFLVGPLSAPALVNKALCSYPVAFIASPALGLPKSRVSIARFAHLPIVTFGRNTQPYMQLLDLLQTIASPPTRIHTSASVATIARMALDGLGVAVLPPATVRDELHRGRLIELRTLEKLPALNFVAAWAAGADQMLITEVWRLARDVAAVDTRPAEGKLRKT